MAAVLLLSQPGAQAIRRKEEQRMSREAIARALSTTKTLLNGSGETSCKKYIYNLKFAEVEHDQPELSSCQITVYADLLQRAFDLSPCRAQSMERADVVIAPGYLAEECNWPHYGRGCGNGKGTGSVNVVRAGEHCGYEAIRKLRSQVPEEKQVFVIDSLPFRPCNKLGPWALVASINARNSCPDGQAMFYSMPPPPTKWVDFDEHRWGPLKQKKHFASFVGNLGSHPVRRAAQMLLDNPPKYIVTSSQPDSFFKDALQNSQFVLILRGDVEFSYRFSEAVCGGGIPVLVTDLWVPPMEPLVKFEEYGVLIQEKEIDTLKIRLESMDDATKNRLQQKSKSICKKYVHDIAGQVTLAIKAATM